MTDAKTDERTRRKTRSFSSGVPVTALGSSKYHEMRSREPGQMRGHDWAALSHTMMR